MRNEEVARTVSEQAEKNAERIKSVEDAIRTLNHEMGVVQGQLMWITRFTGATTLAIISQILYNIVTGS